MGYTLGIGLLHLLVDLGVPVTHRLWCDNQAAIAVMDDSSSWRTRHLSVRASALRDQIRAGELHLRYAPTGEQRADGLTKHLGSRELVARSRVHLGMREEECVSTQQTHA